MKSLEKKIFNKQLKNIIDDGFIIIATGKYIGEGFDEDKLNTLFLTMPFKWNGTLAQYVGRLHRNNENKNEVKVYDYIDLKIRMFSNMFNKRLTGYKKLGYKLVSDKYDSENKLFGSYEYNKHLFKDIEYAQKSITISIIAANMDKLNEIINQSPVKMKILTNQINIDLIENKDKIEIQNVDVMLNGIIIDDKIIWYGGINPLTYDKYDESIMRLDDENYAKDLILELLNGKGIV